ncbi:hypothetical protein BY996DRAFT_4578427 [Phakopsora pachyrhizi]|uniref:Secreted protein n=1 Tax=Phakopsora pachyrhizi TaxID=170000 RepID=A0A0S1MJM5_PHAPC|nr:hypothetical protein BY996DRAFT_4635428 [Phakopsora pachyrhizi]KAI8457430.1 hypothetical protein BY996DRAFT_4578427 [Phakopsora pachyrhizi]
MYSKSLLTLSVLSVCFSVVRSHGLITGVNGANGVTGQAFGTIESTPRDGSGAKPFQQDTSIIRDREIASGKTGGCGRTPAGGENVLSTELPKAESAGLASVGADGKVRMTLHQVNQDGAGPFTCDVDTNADGKDFQKMKVDKNVPGFAGLSRATAADIPLVASMPAGAKCTGGADGQTCIVRCRNGAAAGPFGSCVAVTQAK